MFILRVCIRLNMKRLDKDIKIMIFTSLLN